MKYTIALVLIFISFFAGCERNNNGTIAVIDLDKIASATGRDTFIAEQVQLFTTEQEAKLTKLRDNLRFDIEQEKKKLESGQVKGGQEDINQLTQSRENMLREEIRKVEEAVGQLRVNLVMDFKKEIEPIARKVANQRGMGVIMIKQNAMLYVAPTSDITSDVVDAFQELSIVEDDATAKATALAQAN